VPGPLHAAAVPLRPPPHAHTWHVSGRFCQSHATSLRSLVRGTTGVYSAREEFVFAQIGLVEWHKQAVTNASRTHAVLH
jgi:hypothetical protein